MKFSRVLLVPAGVLALALSFAPAAFAALPPGVTESSFVAANGERVLELSCDVPAGAAEVWAAWTSAPGFTAWATPFARVDLRRGGSIESSYDPKAKAGDPGNIVNEFVALVPNRLCVLRNVRAPEKVPFDAPAFQKTTTAVLLTPLGEKLTRVTVTNSGYGSGEPWDGVYAFFQQGNAWSLAQLRKRFESGPTDWQKVFAPQSAPGK